MKKNELLHWINNARQMLDNAVEYIKTDKSYDEISKQVWRACQLCMDCDDQIRNQIDLENNMRDTAILEARLKEVEKYIEDLSCLKN